MTYTNENWKQRHETLIIVKKREGLISTAIRCMLECVAPLKSPVDSPRCTSLILKVIVSWDFSGVGTSVQGHANSSAPTKTEFPTKKNIHISSKPAILSVHWLNSSRLWRYRHCQQLDCTDIYSNCFFNYLSGPVNGGGECIHLTWFPVKTTMEEYDRSRHIKLTRKRRFQRTKGRIQITRTLDFKAKYSYLGAANIRHPSSRALPRPSVRHDAETN